VARRGAGQRLEPDGEVVEVQLAGLEHDLDKVVAGGEVDRAGREIAPGLPAAGVG